MKIYHVTCWFGNILPENRSPSNISDGAVFRTEKATADFIRMVFVNGGEISSITESEGGWWFESLKEYNRLGSMSLEELHQIQQRGNSQCPIIRSEKSE